MRLRVDVRTTISLVGRVIKYLSIPLLLPLATAVVYEESVIPFVVTMGVALTLGLVLERIEPDPDIDVPEGFLFVGLT